MVNMLAAQLSPSVRAAALAVAKEIDGSSKTNAERLRRRYRTLQRRGQLPAEETEASRLLARRAAEIRALYDQRAERLRDMKRELDNAEKKAKDLNIDISPPASLFTVIHDLELTKGNMETLARSSSNRAFSILLNAGITDRDEAVALVSQAANDLRTAEELLELLHKIRLLRDNLGIPSS